MRAVLRYIAVSLVLLAGFAPPQVALAANLDTTADLVFGQPDFSSNTANNGGLKADSLASAYSMTLDRQGNLYVADTGNNRVLEYDAPLTTHQAASRVFGQPDFTSNTANNGGLKADSLNLPSGVALNAQGNLYVADNNNNRVLEYNAPLTTHQAATHVFGQPNFITNTANNGSVSANSLNGPYGLALDAQGNLYVADEGNERVLRYEAPLTTDTTADRVLGQPNFTSNTHPGSPDAKSLNHPAAVALDASGNLYVADYGDSRVLEYDAPLTTYQAASRVFGQPDFIHGGPNYGGVSPSSLVTPAGLALDGQGNL
jgi:sugar lactone lactonase YvrE